MLERYKEIKSQVKAKQAEATALSKSKEHQKAFDKFKEAEAILLPMVACDAPLDEAIRFLAKIQREMICVSTHTFDLRLLKLESETIEAPLVTLSKIEEENYNVDYYVLLSSCQKAVGAVYKHQGNWRQARTYFHDSLAAYNMIDDEFIKEDYINISDTYTRLKTMATKSSLDYNFYEYASDIFKPHSYMEFQERDIFLQLHLAILDAGSSKSLALLKDLSEFMCLIMRNVSEAAFPNEIIKSWLSVEAESEKFDAMLDEVNAIIDPTLEEVIGQSTAFPIAVAQKLSNQAKEIEILRQEVEALKKENRQLKQDSQPEQVKASTGYSPRKF